jgi:4a-hydroxytetrahydrobiopterin dehydratase
MKPSSAAKKKSSRSLGRNAMLLNQLATPGLGSLLARRWLEGMGQLLLSLVGFGMVFLWFIRLMMGYYGQMMSEGTPQFSIPSGGIALAGAGLFAVAWFWSLFTSFSILRAGTQVSLTSLENFATGLVRLPEEQIRLSLASVPQWQRQGDAIARTYEFADFVVAMKFVNAVASLAEQAQHHPDIDIRWNKVTLALTTHDAGGLSRRDFALAQECDLQAERV